MTNIKKDHCREYLISKGLLQANKTGIFKPFAFEIHPTSSCNLNCKFCNSGKIGQKFDLISDARMRSLPEEAKELGVQHFLILGSGEPFMRKTAVLDMMARVKKYNMWGKLITNATLLDEKSIKTIVDMQWDTITISLDSHIAEQHDYLRGVRGSFDKVLAVKDKFEFFKNQNGTNLPSIDLNFVICNRNYNSCKDFVRFAKDKGFTYITFLPMTVTTPGSKLFDLSFIKREDLLKNLKTAEELSHTLSLPTNLENIIEIYAPRSKKAFVSRGTGTDKKGVLNASCYKPWYHIVVYADARVGCCCASKLQDSITEKRLSEIWQGSYFKTLRSSSQNYKIKKLCDCPDLLNTENELLRKYCLGSVD